MAAVAQMFNLSLEIIGSSPMALIGTSRQCAAELRRRADHWGVSQFIFGTAMGIDERQIRRLREEVISQI
jgi:hypothetical protein